MRPSANMLDEFEEYKIRAFGSKQRCDVTTSRDDTSNYCGSRRPLQEKMRKRASFKSDNSYCSAHRRRTPEQEMLIQRMAELSLRRHDVISVCAADSMDSVFESRAERLSECERHSGGGNSVSDNGSSSGDDEDDSNDINVDITPVPYPSHYQTTKSSCAVRSLPYSPSRISPSSVTSSPVASASAAAAHHRSRSCRVRSRRSDDTASPRHRQRRRTYSVPTRCPRHTAVGLYSSEQPTRGFCGPRYLIHPQQGDDQDQSDPEEQQDSGENGADEEVYRVRTFCTSSKGIVNRGDSFKKRPLSAESSLEGSTVPQHRDVIGRDRTLSATSQGSSACSTDSTGTLDTPYTVLVMGSSGVGISALLQQFLTSEYMGNADDVIEEGTLPSVSVLLDGSEATMEFAEISDAEELTSECGADAFVVVFAVNDRDSYDDAVMCLHELRKRELLARTATILVANKGDIVRGREVEQEEAKVMAVRYGCKYIEVSAIMHLKVDELLVGILKQIRFNDQRKRRSLKQHRKSALISGLCGGSPSGEENGCIPTPLGIVGKILGKHPSYVFRSCDNLLVL